VRLPIKWALFGISVIVVCFPYPGRLIKHVQHWRDPNALIEPEAAGIASLTDELMAQIPEGLPAGEVLHRVERFVYEKVPYDWDWNTWGTADYLPTVDEVIAKGKEDCDGRAVVAASILRRLGYDAQLVTDFAHVWVKTDHGEIMGPGKQKAVTATEKGLRLNARALTNLPGSVAYGVAVFPLSRELILLCVAWVLMIRSGRSTASLVISLLLLVAGLSLLRAGSHEYGHAKAFVQVIALAAWLGAFALPAVAGVRRVTHETKSDT
jgi:hypothetical protein